MEGAKRTGKEPQRSAGKRQKTGGEENDAKATPKGKQASQPPTPPPRSSNTTRRPFFGVIDNVSSFSGIIEGPYDFGFAISITVDRQTFKGVVYKANLDHNSDSVFPDEEVMVNFASSVASANSSTRTTPSPSPSNNKPKPNSQQEEVRLPDISTFHFQHSHEAPRTPHDSPRTPHTPHTPLTPHAAHDESLSPSEGHPSSDTDSQPTTPHNNHNHATPSPHTNFQDHLPAIHSVLQGISNLPSKNGFSSPTPTQPHHAPSTAATSSISAPLPPQPQLQRQKQRQKKRQEKKLMELQQQQPARYQHMLEREKSKIPLLGDETLVQSGYEILQHIEESKHT